MIAVVNILYLIIIVFFVIAALCICYHFVRYSLSKMEMLISLAIFLSVFVVLLFSNAEQFSVPRQAKRKK